MWGFYARCGFQDLPFDPRCAMLVRMIDLQRVFGSEIEPRGVRSPVRDVELSTDSDRVTVSLTGTRQKVLVGFDRRKAPHPLAP
jgi:hypothetical protein